MEISSIDPACADVCKVFGLDPSITRKFTLTFEVNSIVTVDAEQFATVDGIKQTIALMTTKYKLVPMKVPDVTSLDTAYRTSQE